MPRSKIQNLSHGGNTLSFKLNNYVRYDVACDEIEWEI